MPQPTKKIIYIYTVKLFFYAASNICMTPLQSYEMTDIKTSASCSELRGISNKHHFSTCRWSRAHLCDCAPFVKLASRRKETHRNGNQQSARMQRKSSGTGCEEMSHKAPVCQRRRYFTQRRTPERRVVSVARSASYHHTHLLRPCSS